MNILNNIKGAIDYIRYGNGSHWYGGIDKNSTCYAGGTDKLALALNNPVLSAVFNIRANCLSKARFYVLETNGDKNYEHKSLELINNPNAFQSKEDFIKQYEWLRCAYGWVYQKPFGATGFTPSAIYNLNPSKIEFPSNMGDALLWDDKDVREYKQKEFKYTDVETKKSVMFEDIIPFFDVANGLTDSDVANLTSPSRIDSIIKQISNIGLATDAENIIIQSNGREMIFAESKSNGSNQFVNDSVPMGDTDRQDISNKLNNSYSLRAGQQRTLTPDKPMAWVPMTVKVGDLGLNESITANSSIITQLYGVPNEIYQSYKAGSTFENQAQAEVKFYQNAMQTEADNLASSYTAKFGNGIVFGASFEHLPMMQDVEDKKTDKVAKISKAFKDLTSAGMSTEQSIAMMQSLGVNIEL